MSKQRYNNDGTNLIINYIPQTLDEDELSELFSECGMIEDVKVIRDAKTQISRGFAFIKYVDKDSADRAIKKFTGHKMGRKTLRVSLSRPAGAETRDANLIIENLPVTMTEDTLYEQFSIYGQIVTHRLLKTSTGESKGKAYVRFNTKAEAEDAIIGLNGINIGGDDDLVVKLADPPVVKPTPELVKKKNQMRATTQPYPPPSRNVPHRDPYLAQPEYPEHQLPTHTMPPRFGFGPRPASRPPMGPRRSMSPFGKPYNHPHAAGYEGYESGPVNPTRGHSRPSRGRLPPAHERMDYGEYDHVQQIPPASVDPSFEDSSRIEESHRSSYDADKGWCVFVYGIPTTSTNETLYSMFARFGAINTVKPFMDQDDVCKGFGFVHMINYDDACKAINVLNGNFFQGTKLQVRFKNDKK